MVAQVSDVPSRGSLDSKEAYLAYIILILEGRYSEWTPLYLHVLEVRESNPAPEHLDFATSLENGAAVLRDTGRAQEAGKTEARAKAIRIKHQ